MKLLRTLFLYIGINAILLPLNIGIAWWLTHVGVQYLIATAVGYGFHIALLVILNRKFTFCDRDIHVPSAMTQASFVHGSSFLIAMWATYLLVEFATLTYFWSRVIAAIVAGIWDIVLDLKFTFSHRKK